MTRPLPLLAILLVVFAALAPADAAVPEAGPTRCASADPWSGTWRIWGAKGLSFGTMTVIRVGDMVHGTYTGAEHRDFRILGGWFEGKVAPDGSVRGRWYDDGPEKSRYYAGDFRWRLSKPAMRFGGRWKTDLETTYWRQWYGWRVRAGPCPGHDRPVS